MVWLLIHSNFPSLGVLTEEQIENIYAGEANYKCYTTLCGPGCEDLYNR
jgi:hypothetical protein